MAKQVLTGKNETEKKSNLASEILDTLITSLNDKVGEEEIIRIDKPLKVNLSDRVDGKEVEQVKEFSGNTLVVNASDSDGNDVLVALHPEILHYSDTVVNKKGQAKIPIALADIAEALGKNIEERKAKEEKAQAEKEKKAQKAAEEQLAKAQRALETAQQNAKGIADTDENSPEENLDAE